MIDIFGNLEINKKDTIPQIEGLTYIPNWISSDESDQLLSIIDQNLWELDLKRRVQQYGYKYDYRSSGSFIKSKDNYIGILPEWLQSIAERLYNEKVFTGIPDQVIINEYLAGQGIANHTDCIPCFGNVITSLSLGSSVIMNFINEKDKDDQRIHLEPNSLLILSGKARYDYTHGIKARKSDIINGKKVLRTRRVSITLRQII